MRRLPLGRPGLALVAVCTLWGTIPLLTRDLDLPAAAIVAVRVWAGVVALAVVAGLRRRTGGEAASRVDGPGSARLPLRALAVGPLLALHWTAMFAGFSRAPAEVVIFVVFLAPVGIALLAPLILGERLDATTGLALLVAVAGFVLIAGRALGGATAPGVAFAAASAALLVVLVLVSKPLAERLGGFRLARIELLGAGVTLLPVVVRTDWSGPRPSQWAALAVLGLVHTGIAIAVYLDALARVPATAAGVLGYLEPVGVVVFSWLVLGRGPSVTTVAGGALIVVAGVLVLRSTSSARAVSPEVPVRVPG